MNDSEFKQLKVKGNALVDELEHLVEAAFSEICRKRIEKSLNSELIEMPKGLSRKQIQEFLFNNASKELDKMVQTNQDLGLYD